MTIQKIRSSRVTSITADEFVGPSGMIFYNEDLGDLRLGDGLTLGGIPLYTLPTATATRLGGVKIGNNISIIDGVISVADTFSGDYNNLTNKPHIPTDINELTDSTNLLSSAKLTIKSNNVILSSQVTSINFSGTGVNTTVNGNNVNVVIDGIITTTNIDGGNPFSVFGGIVNLDGGVLV